MLCALVLSLCGVDDETIAYEYNLTELGLAPLKDRAVKRLMENPSLKGNPEGAINMLSAKWVTFAHLFHHKTNLRTRIPNMMATLKMIKEKYGSAEGYVTKECGLTQEEVEMIRTNLVVDIPHAYSKA